MTVLTPPTEQGIAEAPSEAFRFQLSPLQFADAKEAQDGVYPFAMLARSADEIYHWYWGRIVHDMAGMQLRKPRVTIDYQHDFDTVIGYADKFSVTEEGLHVTGALVSTREHDRAHEIYNKGRAGVPYESSIDWEGPDSEVEWIPEGVTTEVNGRQFSGPGYVVRQWPLRSIAVCRYGVDPDTRTQFSQKQSNQIRQFSLKVKTMADETKTEETPDEEKTAFTKLLALFTRALSLSSDEKDPEKELADSDTDDEKKLAQKADMITVGTLKQFSDEFGDQATAYLAKGMTLEAARHQFAVHQRDAAIAQNKQLSEQVEKLEAKLKQFGVDLGQEAPVETDGDGKEGKDNSKAKQFAVHGGDNRGAFAASLKLKGQAS